MAAMQVFNIIPGTAWVKAKALPPLKPNHPNQINKVPRAAKGKLCPPGKLIPALNLPTLGPMMITAAKAIQPPTAGKVDKAALF